MSKQMVKAESGKLTTAQQRGANVKALLDRMAPEIATALPRTGVAPERFIRIALTTVRKTPKLLQCSDTSLLAGVMGAAQLGLTIDGVTGDAYLVPYGKEAVLLPGYRGLMKMARNSGKVAKIEARIVHENDEFGVYYGTDPRIDHTPDPWVDRSDPAKIVGAYAIAVVRDEHGATYEQFETMGRDDIEKVRSRSRASNGGPWVTDWAEMAKKTVVRRLCKYLPMDTEEQRLVNQSERADAGMPVKPDEGTIIDVEAKMGTAQAEDEIRSIAQEVQVGEPPEEDGVRESWIDAIESEAVERGVTGEQLDGEAKGPWRDADVGTLSKLHGWLRENF